jgi:uroporphyrinogen III methyltransferase/synthase
VVKGTLSNIVAIADKEKIKAPAIIIIGHVVNLEMKDPNIGHLNNIQIGITGTKRFRDKLSKELQELDCEVSHLFGLDIEEYTNNESFIKEIQQLKNYSWLILTSSNGVEIFFESLKKIGVDFRNLAHLKIAVIGEGTKETLVSYGYIPDYMPEVFTAEALGDGLKDLLNSNDKLLIARALKGSHLLTEIFDREKIDYTDLKIYNLTEGTIVNKEQIKNMNYITFGSSSGVETFFKYWTLKDLKEYPELKLVSIGSVTSESLRNYGVESFLTAEEASINSMVSCIQEDILKE